jgi:hypothetical protein
MELPLKYNKLSKQIILEIATFWLSTKICGTLNR